MGVIPQTVITEPVKQPSSPKSVFTQRGITNLINFPLSPNGNNEIGAAVEYLQIGFPRLVITDFPASSMGRFLAPLNTRFPGWSDQGRKARKSPRQSAIMLGCECNERTTYNCALARKLAAGVKAVLATARTNSQKHWPASQAIKQRLDE